MKLGVSFAIDHALAQPLIGEEPRPLRRPSRSVAARRNHLEQVQVARRIEEVGAERVRRERRRSSFDDGGDGDAGGVRADDGVGAAACSTRSNSARLTSSRSTIASTIQSAVADARRGRHRSCRCWTSARAAGVKNGSGFSAAARARPSRAASAVTSSSRTGTPALAKCAAICAPIVPAPSTATRRMCQRPPLVSWRPRPPMNKSTIASASAASE